VLERVMPARKDSPISIELPAVNGAAGLVEAGQAILAAVASGEITPNEADALMSLIERQRRIVETADLEARLAAWREKQNEHHPHPPGRTRKPAGQMHRPASSAASSDERRRT
jgi:hypothetical protein